MRKIIGLLLLLTQFSCAKHPQDRLTFKIQFQPEKKYSQIAERTYQSVTKFSGSEISMQRLKIRGLQNPTISSKNSRTESVLKTGKRNDGNNFPVTMEYIKTTSNDGKKDIPDGTIFQGICIGTNMPKFNSVASEGFDEMNKTTALQTLQNTFSQLTFPEKELKIGEQFSMEYPLSIPMEGSKIEMVVTNTYKLISISNNLANFDIAQQYQMIPKLMDNSFKGTGNGNGHLVYDVANTIILNYAMNTEMELNKKLDSFDFNLKTKSGFIQTTTLLRD
jgi:hypothetical protein